MQKKEEKWWTIEWIHAQERKKKKRINVKGRSDSGPMKYSFKENLEESL